jgi:UDP-3-O-[3-hydroxymyristoyl] glucosamine N-acyltransferase
MAITLEQVVAVTGGELVGDPTALIERIAPLQQAKSNEATFLTSSKYRSALDACQAGVVLVKARDAEHVTGNAIIMDDPYVGYARLAQLLDTTPKAAEGIHPSAVIAADAVIGVGASIGANAVIESGAVIGEQAVIGANCFVGRGSRIGVKTQLWANVSVYHDVIIGDEVLIQSGAVIGSDGFGYANHRGQWIKIPQTGRVIIGHHCEIGACTTIDRGALEDTILGEGVMIDNQCQIAHNVEIGDHCAIAGGTIIAGSHKMGKYCVAGGGCVINGHISICDQVQLTGMTMVMRSIDKPGVYSSGIPAQPNLQWRKATARVMKVDEMHKKLVSLEKQVQSDKN